MAPKKWEPSKQEGDAMMMRAWWALKPHEHSPAESNGILNASHYENGRLQIKRVTPAKMAALAELPIAAAYAVEHPPKDSSNPYSRYVREKETERLSNHLRRTFVALKAARAPTPAMVEAVNNMATEGLIATDGPPLSMPPSVDPASRKYKDWLKGYRERVGSVLAHMDSLSPSREGGGEQAVEQAKATVRSAIDEEGFIRVGTPAYDQMLSQQEAREKKPAPPLPSQPTGG
eukprot:Hpha_TRINITY_DN35893_c0_g1::TRINITY_DN35893_c0_g1_i1::g.84944::m.84944